MSTVAEKQDTALANHIMEKVYNLVFTLLQSHKIDSKVANEAATVAANATKKAIEG